VGIDAFSQAFTNPLLAELIYNKDTYTPVGWDIVQNTNTLSDIFDLLYKASHRSLLLMR
jgi:prostaglandin-endoperoxide synthase 2